MQKSGQSLAVRTGGQGRLIRYLCTAFVRVVAADDRNGDLASTVTLANSMCFFSAGRLLGFFSFFSFIILTCWEKICMYVPLNVLCVGRTGMHELSYLRTQNIRGTQMTCTR